MPTGQVSSAIAVAGLSINSETTRTESGQISHEVTLPAGNAGTLTTRTDDDTGIATLSEGHGITDADTVDVYWTGGVRYGLTVTAYDGTTVSIDVGAGDALPTQDTAVVVTARVEIDSDFDGDLVELIAAHSTKRAHVDFLNDTPASLKAVELTANEAWVWASDQGFTNPLTGDPVDTIQVTCGEASAATLKIGVLYDSA